jgi:hypothetical protein
LTVFAGDKTVCVSAKLKSRIFGRTTMFLDISLNSPRSRFRAALLLAVVADAVQIIGFPLFAEGAISPVDDILDVVVGVALTGLLGWHWEFTPSLVAKLVPGIDLVPFWTLAVASVYRKWKRVESAGAAGAEVEVVSPQRKLLNH